MSVYIIAEAGVNHNGNIEIAKKMVDKAVECGVDCIKLQTFIAEQLVSKNTEKAEYQKKQTKFNESQYEMLKRLELSFEDFKTLKEYCDLKKIDFMSTGFDFKSIEFLESLNIDIWKIPSGEITNLPYLIKIAKLNKPVILSTGMSTSEEVRSAIYILKSNGCREITLLHCTTEYPTPLEDVNLKAMITMKNDFGTKIGYSDHTEGIEVSIAAVALGATVIEKHFTLDRKMEGPDHKASLEPDQLKNMVDSIRNIEKALGNGIKQPVESEKKNIKVARKSIVAKNIIKAGDVFTEENITVKRPGNGISPMKWFDVIGKTARRNFDEDELIEV